MRDQLIEALASSCALFASRSRKFAAVACLALPAGADVKVRRESYQGHTERGYPVALLASPGDADT
jgi:hypothetical protein